MTKNVGCLHFMKRPSDKEIAATYQLLYPSHCLLHPEYMKLVAAVRALRMECIEEMLAIGAHRKKVGD